jgi:fatty acid desaturase
VSYPKAGPERPRRGALTDLAHRPIAAVEWPTLALALMLPTAFMALTWFHAAIPWWAFVAAAAWITAWHGSLQHEAIHGHPTRSAAVNALLAHWPLALWLPYLRYRDTHLAHHRDELLTDPLDDPESRYLSASRWAALHPLGRRALAAQTTLAGRLILGPAWSIGGFLVDDARRLARGEPGIVRAWLLHAPGAALVALWVFAVCEVPAWLYLLGVVQGGTALSLLRAFAEHRAARDVAHRTAIVENSTLFGPLFLFNNLHVAHHRWPHVPWYRLPALHAANRAALHAANAGLVYDGYGEIFRRFLLTPHDHPVHPQGCEGGAHDR